MATFTVNTAKHAVLSSNVVDEVTLNNPCSFLIVSNRTTSGQPIFFTFGDPTKGVTAPTVGGDDCYVCLIGMTITIPGDGTRPLVKLISSGAQAYSVMVV